MNLTQNELKQILDYDKTIGIFYWKIACGNQIKIGDVAGNKESNNYIRIRIKGKSYLAHRLAWLWVYGVFPKELDHINRIRDDNRICNLREVKHFENQRNRNKLKNNSSGVTGVSWYEPSKKWNASIKINGKSKNLGYFSSFTDAVKVRKNAEIQYGFISGGK